MFVDPDPLEGSASMLAAQISDEDAVRISDTYRLLGDPTRIRLLYALLEAGELCVGHLAEQTGTQESAVSHALRLLRTAGVVSSRRAGRHMYYALADAHVSMILDLTLEHLEHEPEAQP